MQEKDFKFIDNAVTVEEGVKTINLFTGINEDSAREFVYEFKWLEAYSEAKRIDIKINSSGGSVLHGWSIVETILNSTIPTRAIVVGVAASMASVIMTAADESKIMDYASVMVHNPFYSKEGKTDANDEQLATFRAQLITLYTKRLNKSEAEVEALMDGKEGQDGTWFKAEKALSMGLVSEIIPTPSQHSSKFFTVSNEVQNSSETADLMQAKYNELINNLNKGTINMKEVIAKLGLEESTTEATVLAKVSALMEEKQTLADTVNTLKVEQAGAAAVIEQANATITEKTSAIEALTAKVAEFEQEKNAQETARRLAIVEAAVSEGKINDEQKDHWLELFANAPAATEQVLAQLAAVGKKKKLSEQVKPEAEKEAGESEFKLPTIHSTMDEINAKK